MSASDMDAVQPVAIEESPMMESESGETRVEFFALARDALGSA